LRASDGRILSLVAGWKRHNTMEIEWQMNRADLPGYSLSTVMRSYLLEHAIAQGFERLYMEGGTPHSIQSAFQCEVATELIAVRSTLHARLLGQLVQRVFPRDNHIVELFRNPDLEWRPISTLCQPETMNLRRLSA
jgi:hypothetical protein